MDLEFEWDEKKRQSNLEKHKIDFVRARFLFDGRPVHTWPSSYNAEPKLATIGVLNGLCYTAIWTLRGSAIRLISVRRSRNDEIREYHKIHGG